MKKIIFVFIFLIIFSNIVSAGDIFRSFQIDPGSPFQNVENLSGIREIQYELFEKENVNINVYFPSEKKAKENGYDGERLARDAFSRADLNHIATPSLNLIIVVWEDESGNAHIDVGYAKDCGWTEKGLFLLTSHLLDREDLTSFEFWETILKKVSTSLETYNLDYLKSYCEFAEELKDKYGCKSFFPELEEKRDFSSKPYKIVFIFDDYKQEDFELVRNNFKEVLLGLKKNDYWNKNFDKFQFEYLDELLFNNYSGVGSPSSNVGISYLESYCLADNVAFIANSRFRSFALPPTQGATGSAYFSFPFVEKDYWIGDYSYFLEDETLLVHEFGHSVFCLRDEYTEEGRGNFSRPPNCASNLEEAFDFWGTLIGRGEDNLFIKIWPGCSYIEENIRPTYNSVMREHFNEINYGIVNERWADSILKGEVECIS